MHSIHLRPAELRFVAFRFFARLLLVLCAFVSMAAPVSARGTVRSESHSPDPTSVTIAGSMQSQLGCSGDWQADCAATHLTFDAVDQAWQGSFVIPAGSWQYKAALNDSWEESYPGGLVSLDLASDTPVKFYYDHPTHWITSNVNAAIATAAGDFQSELGCTGDWQPDCLQSWLKDPEGDGTYTFTTTSLPQGNYQTKVTIDEAWTENYGAGGSPGGANIAFTVPFTGAQMLFSYDGTTHVLTISAKQGAHDDNISWSDLLHDSRSALYRTPSGAVTTGTSVTLRLRALAGDLTSAQVRVWDDRTDSQSYVAMAIAASDGQYDWWEATLPAETDPTILSYRFIAHDGTASAVYEDDAALDGGTGETTSSSAERNWQLTQYDPAFTTPSWAKNGIVYQIFPDRFRDGDSSNDTPAGSFFYDESGGTIRRSTQSNWNATPCDPRDPLGACPGRYGSDFFGGDLQGVIDKLPYLDDLGVTVLYLNPIFESPSNHRYDTSDYRQIDDSLGDLALFQSLTTQAHALGMKVVVDGSFDYTSSDSEYFDRYHRFSSPDGACENTGSQYRTWYYFSASGTPGTGPCAGDTIYSSWFGYDTFPKLNTTINATRQLIWDDLNSVSRYWLAQGADGWRLDVGGDIDSGLTNDPSNDFWEGFRSAVRAWSPDTWIVGEEWGVATPWMLGSEWDSAMNYQFSSAVLGFWRDETFTDDDHSAGSSAGELAPLSPSELDARLHNLEERYPRESFLAMMNLLDSHDTNRALFMLDHRADENDPSIYQSPSYDWSDAMTRLKGAALLQMTLPGAPTIYYGDEVGLVGPVAYAGGQWVDDPYNRQPYPWLDETGTPFYTHLQSGGSGETLRTHYQLLASARNAHAALRTGSFDTLRIDDANDVYAYGRRADDASDAAVVLINRSSGVQTISVDVAGYLAEGAEFHDVLDANAAYFVSGGVLSVADVPARSGALLVLASTHPAPPTAVTDLAATSGSTSISLSWTAAMGATSYDVYSSLLSGGGYTFAGNTTATSYAVTGLTQAVDYYFVVVSRDDATGLTSGYSNEVTGRQEYDLSDSGTSSFVLQWPATIAHTISAVNSTESIYGDLWIQGATESEGATAGIRAQVGFAPDGAPLGSAWQWSEMTFLTQSGNNDEFVGTLLPDAVGEYDYAVRFSANDGADWWYADLNGPQRDGTLDNPGSLTVNASSDTTAPVAPSGLTVTSASGTAISLAWAAVTDGDLSGYEVFRELIAAPGYVRIASVSSSTTTFTDLSVTGNAGYRYHVKAFDTSFNRSAASNAVEATAAIRYVDITFHATVPSFTPAAASVYIVGSIGELGSWNPGLIATTKSGPTEWTYTLHVADGTAFDFTFTRGSWDSREEMSDGSEVTRSWVASYGTTGTQNVDVTIATWHDPIVVTFSPAANATSVATSSTVWVTWSRTMPSSTDFTVSSSSGSVSGTFANDGTTTTFTPAGPLLQGTTYTVLVTGETSTAGGAQQVAASWTFTTACAVTTPVITTDGDPTFCEGGSVQLTSSSESGNQWYRDGLALTGENATTLVTSIGGNYTVVALDGSCASAPSAAMRVTVRPKPDATIAVASTMDSGASAAASVNVACNGASFSWSISGGTITSGNGTPRIVFTAGAPGTLTLTITVTNGYGCTDTKSADVDVQLAPFGAPPMFRATAEGTSANLQWAAVQSADHYEIYRSSDNVNWTLRSTTSATTWSDSGLAPSSAQLYRVRAIRADSTASAFSAIDFATTTSFGNVFSCPPLIRASHVLQLRSAINIVRAAIGLSPVVFTDPSLAAGGTIKAIYVTELRSALAPALSAIGVTPAYTDGTITPGVTTAKAAHITELQDLVR